MVFLGSVLVLRLLRGPPYCAEDEMELVEKKRRAQAQDGVTVKAAV
jgi:hypothetical protein